MGGKGHQEVLLTSLSPLLLLLLLPLELLRSAALC
jgi:hypothetical protein